MHNVLHKLRARYLGMSDKDRIVYKNAVGAFAVKGLGLVISLFTMPAYMRYFADQQVLGIWFTVLSVLTWILNFDLGIGNGLRNKLTAELTLGNRKAAKQYISSAYWMIGTVVIVLLMLGCFAIPHINWNAFFNIELSIIDNQSLSGVVIFTFVGIMAQFFLRLVSSTLYAMQKSAVNNLIGLLTSFLQLLFALLAPSYSPIENLKMFSIAHAICANMPLLVATIWVFGFLLKDCRPNPRFFRKSKAKEVLSLGGIFFLCQVLYMLIANTNEFFITQYTSPENVVEYQVYNRLFTLGSTLFMLALTPVWSAVSKSIAEKDFRWLQKLNKTLVKLSALACCAEFLIIPLLQVIVNVWLQEEAIQVNYGYACCFALFGSAMVAQSAVSTVANGTGRMRIQALCYGGGIVLKFIIIHFGMTVANSWIVVPFANAVILIPYIVIQYIDMNKYIQRNIQEQLVTE